MVKAMYAGVAGLKAHQSRMDVISNNIANVNTWGYKAMNASFKESMYQQVTSGSAGSTVDGGYGATNPSMIGYGSLVSAISANFTQGSPAPTDRGLDLFIDGPAFFAVGPMYGDNDEKSPDDIYYSRVGDFEVRNGYLVDSNGRYVYGSSMTQGGEVRKEGSGTGKITYQKGAADLAPTVGYLSASQYGIQVNAGETVEIVKVVDKGGGKYDITYTRTPGDTTATGTVPANGAAPSKGSYLTAADAATYSIQNFNPDTHTCKVVSDATNNTFTVVISPKNSNYKGPDFQDGRMILDSATGGYSLAEGVSTLRPLKIPTSCSYSEVDPATGNIVDKVENDINFNSFSIDSTGMIYGTSESSGRTYLLGAINLVNVVNPNGMMKSDGPYYQSTGSSGDGLITAAGGQNGSLTSGYLEMANVDIATEFSSMITTQRGFQANSKIITVTDEMLQELVNMKR